MKALAIALKREIVRGFPRRPRALVQLALLALLASLLIFVVSCGAGSPRNTLAPEGDVADQERDLFLLALWPAIIVFLVVEVLLIIVVVRFRRRRGEEQAFPKQVHGNQRLEVAWTLAPLALLLFLAVPTIKGIVDLGRAPASDALRVKVTAFQWAWRFEYPDILDAQGKPLVAPTSEMAIPVGREIRVDVESTDVIHSFWVPKLAGKLDAIPGRTNTMWLKADRAGTYTGQCAEFCGLGHAGMTLRVQVLSAEDFQAWVTEQLQQAEGP